MITQIWNKALWLVKTMSHDLQVAATNQCLNTQNLSKNDFDSVVNMTPRSQKLKLPWRLNSEKYSLIDFIYFSTERICRHFGSTNLTLVITQFKMFSKMPLGVNSNSFKERKKIPFGRPKIDTIKLFYSIYNSSKMLRNLLSFLVIQIFLFACI